MTQRASPYGAGVGLTGLIFGCIAAAWLVYLVPYFLHQRTAPAVEDVVPDLPFTPSVTIVRSGSSLATAEDGAAKVSTPLTRRAALYELKQTDRRAAQRRRRVLIALLAVQVLSGGIALLGWVPWWVALVPAVLIAGFLVVARYSVKAMRADLARRASAIVASADEDTVALKITVEDVAEHEHSVELTGPVSPVGSLWEPIPITRPTYVSKPLAPRTVRTIDLSAPVPARQDAVPVTADAPVIPVDDEREREIG